MKKIIAVISAIGTAAVFILLNGPSMLVNAEELPSAFSKVKDTFLGWYYEDEEWSGRWSVNPQGYVDREDMSLSAEELRIEIQSQNGKIDGTIATKKICAAIPVFNFILIEGSVDGNTAQITAFDFIGGRRQNFAKLILKREGVIMTVTATEGAVAWFPKNGRIAHHPDSDRQDDFDNLCNEEQQNVFKKLHPARGSINLRAPLVKE